jgi:hypothetical protein
MENVDVEIVGISGKKKGKCWTVNLIKLGQKNYEQEYYRLT